MGFLARLFAKPNPAPSTGRTFTSAQLAGLQLSGVPAHFSDDTFAEVSADWLPAFFPDFRAVLFREGIVKWDSRFDCDNFAAFYVALAQIRFFAASFHAVTPATSLALGEFWYRRDTGGSHAVVLAITSRGPVWIEPQTGAELTLTAQERASCFLLKF